MSNNHMELWALLDFVSKSHVGDKKDFKQYYEKALKAGMKMDASQHELRQRILRQADLRRLIDEWMLQRTKEALSREAGEERREAGEERSAANPNLT